MEYPGPLSVQRARMAMLSRALRPEQHLHFCKEQIFGLNPPKLRFDEFLFLIEVVDGVIEKACELGGVSATSFRRMARSPTR